MKFECWYIENPVSKELTKRITLKLGPKAEQDFIIVMRSPLLKFTQNMLTVLNVGLLTFKNEKFGVDISFEDFLKHQYDNSMKAFLQDRKKLSSIQRRQLLIAGKLVPPKLQCLKEINSKGLEGVKIIPIALRRGPVAKLKLPFRGLVKQYPEQEIEFSFLKTSAAFENKAFVQELNASPVEF